MKVWCNDKDTGKRTEPEKVLSRAILSTTNPTSTITESFFLLLLNPFCCYLFVLVSFSWLSWLCLLSFTVKYTTKTSITPARLLFCSLCTLFVLLCPDGLGFYLFSLLYNNTHNTNIHAAGGIRNRNPSKRSAADPRLKPRDHWDGHLFEQRRTLVPCHKWIQSNLGLHGGRRAITPLRHGSARTLWLNSAKICGYERKEGFRISDWNYLYFTFQTL